MDNGGDRAAQGHAGVGSNPAAACGRCGAPFADGARFCASCGAAISSATDVSAAQRRYLVILFCDLVGSTELSQRMDPEDLADLVLSYQETGRAIVHRFGGHVAQYLGDGLLVFFGYPIAHENNADRAVLAGLEILRQLVLDESPLRRAGLQARVGIHAGETVVGALGSADRADTSVFSSTPNIAARLEGFAAPGTVVISDEVRSALSAHFDVKDLGTPPLKGVAEVVQVWEVAGVRDVDARSADDATTPLVGRDAERASLFGVLEQAMAGRPSTALLVAEPGLGKSRLVQALFERLVGEPHLWLECECRELARASPLRPVAELLRRRLRFEPDAAGEGEWSTLRGMLTAVHPYGDVAARYLADVMGIHSPADSAPSADTSVGAELRRRRSIEAVASWIRALAKEQLVVLVVEDLHWADPTTLDWLSEVVETGEPCRLLCVLTSRPPAPLRAHIDSVTHIALAPLDAESVMALTRDLASGSGVPDELLAVVADRSDGVPLFIEQLVKAAVDDPHGEAVAVPRTLQSLLEARLDLVGPARAVAQAASVLGRDVPLELLSVISPVSPEELDARLGELVDAGFMSRATGERGVSYGFRHALLRDAAYMSMVRRERRRIHDEVATALTDRFSALAEQAPELLAHHLSGAQRRLEAAASYERAGRRAVERAALREALDHYRRGLELLEDEPPSRARDAQRLSLNILVGNALMGTAGLSSDEALEAWQAAIDDAEALGDDEELTSALNGAAVYYLDRADSAQIDALTTRIIDVADRTGSRVATLRGNGTLALSHFYRGHGERALEHVQVAMRCARDGDFFTVTYGVGHDEETFFHMVASWVQWWLGRPDASLALARRGLEIALAVPSSLSQAMARHAVAMAHHLRGERAAAADAARENASLSESLGFPFWTHTAHAILGTERAISGDAGGLDELRAALDGLGEIGNVAAAPLGMIFLAEASLGVDRPGEAVEAADLGLALADATGQPFGDADLLCLKARALCALGQHDAALAASRQSLDAAQRLGAASSHLRAALTLASVIGDRGGEEVVGHLRAALARMGDGASTLDQVAARRTLATLGADSSAT